MSDDDVVIEVETRRFADTRWRVRRWLQRRGWMFSHSGPGAAYDTRRITTVWTPWFILNVQLSLTRDMTVNNHHDD